MEVQALAALGTLIFWHFAVTSEPLSSLDSQFRPWNCMVGFLINYLSPFVLLLNSRLAYCGQLHGPI